MHAHGGSVHIKTVKSRFFLFCFFVFSCFIETKSHSCHYYIVTSRGTRPISKTFIWYDIFDENAEDVKRHEKMKLCKARTSLLLYYYNYKLHFKKLLICHEHDQVPSRRTWVCNCKCMLLNIDFSLQILLFQRTARWQGQPTSKSAGGSDCFAGNKKLASLLWGFRSRATPWEGYY